MAKVLPLVVAGAAVYLLMPKKKAKKKVRRANGKKANGNGDPNIVKSGTQDGWGWQVRRVDSEPGFADLYLGEVNAPDSKEWSKVHPDGRSSIEQARLLALEAIAKAIQDLENGGEPGHKIVLEGTTGGWRWRVYEGTPVVGFANMYFGQIMAPDSNTWVEAHKDGRPDPEIAKLLALEQIALAEEAKGA